MVIFEDLDLLVHDYHQLWRRSSPLAISRTLDQSSGPIAYSNSSAQTAVLAAPDIQRQFQMN